MEKEMPPLNCNEHPKLLLNFYCSSHDVICCENCKSELHSACPEIQTIKEVSKGINDRELLPDLFTRMAEAKESLTVTTDRLEDNISTLSRQFDNISLNIQNARRTINEHFDKVESKLTNTVYEHCIKGVEEKIIELERRKYTLELWEDELQSAVRSDDEEIIFSMVKILNELQKDMESYIDIVRQDIKCSLIRWKPIKTDTRTMERFVGDITLIESPSTQSTGTAQSEHIFTRESSRISNSMSIGTVNIHQENKTEEGLDGISAKTEQGWNETSSAVSKNVELSAAGFEDGLNVPKDDIREKRNHEVQIIREVDISTDKQDEGADKNGNDSIEEIQSTNEIIKGRDNGEEIVKEKQHKRSISSETSGGKTAIPDIPCNKSGEPGTFTISPDAKEKRESSVISNAKLKFEATLLDQKSSAEVKKGLYLTNDTLLFLDKTNKHIFLCDKNGKVSHKINLIYEPEDIAIIDDTCAVVTLGEHGIQSINVKSLKKDQAHDVGGWCGAITSYKGQIIVSVDMKLRLLDTFGYTLRRILHDGNAYTICSDKTGRIFYTDSMNHTVHCIAWYGIPVFTYSNKTLKCPIGIVVDSDFFIYVAGFESCNVQKLWPNGRFHSQFLSEKDELYEPSSLAYNEAENELLVVSDNNQSIETYGLNDHFRPQQ